MSNKKGLTVKEYAAAHGISVASVYKQISNKRLNVVELVENGRKVKYINGFNDSDSTDIQPDSTDIQPDSTKKMDERAAAIIAEKDARIADLEKRIEELTERLLKQNEELIALVKESHILVAQSQALRKELPPTVEETAEQPKPKKRRFWQRKKDLN